MKDFRPILISIFIAVSFLVAPTFGKEQWVQVKSKNFVLVGNASEKEVRKVGTRLEEFREVFRIAFPAAKIDTVPTVVIVFKDESTYNPFRSKARNIRGYFSSGNDSNYITMLLSDFDRETFEIIFHEYVHSVIDANFGRSGVPRWFNEGIAQYYQTFQISDDKSRVKLGVRHADNLRQLQGDNRLVPMWNLFNSIDFRRHGNSGTLKDVFYPQSWVFVHYLLQNGKSADLDKFLNLVLSGTPLKAAFVESFRTTLEQMDKQLDKYVWAGHYDFHELTLNQPLVFEYSMQTAPLTEAEVSAYLGSLLYHIGLSQDAELYLLKSISLQPNTGLANTTLAKLLIAQRNFEAARVLLENAISTDPGNHVALYQYALLLSREGREDGSSVPYVPATTAKIKAALISAIRAAAWHADSYDLLAHVALVNSEPLGDAVKAIKIALMHAPGNDRYRLRLAELYCRQNKLGEASALLQKVKYLTEETDISSRVSAVQKCIDREPIPSK